MDKAAQRRLSLERRRTMGAQAREAASGAICRKLMAMPHPQVIFSYQAMDEEVNLAAFHRWAWARGLTLAFPVTGAGGQMEAYVPAGLWVYDRYGIRIPNVTSARRLDPAEIGLVLAPLVAFDEAAHRLGHGGGYYDRFFLRCPAAYRLGIAFEAQKLPAISCTPLDLALHSVLTECGRYSP